MATPLPIVPAHPAADACCAPAAGVDPALDAERIAAVARALGAPVRVQIVDVLRRSEQDNLDLPGFDGGSLVVE